MSPSRETGARRRDLLAAAVGAAGWMLVERAADATTVDPEATAGATSPRDERDAPRAAAPPSDHAANATGPLAPPADGSPIAVAVLVSRGAQVIDFCGPWEVFQDVRVDGPGGARHPFRLFTVADSTEPVRATGGLHLIPDHDFDSAPTPRVVVVPALRSSRRMLDWLRGLDERTDVVLSVCTGSFVLAEAGLLDGRVATTHHLFVDRLRARFPDVDVRADVRWAESDGVATAGGLTSGIDLALRIVERYFGRDVALATVRYLEYSSPIWTESGSVPGTGSG